ncbi:MAG: dienelactone hydrolase family protein [Gammaproteobacteria bacterium]|nr:dienelactone hydrolase family protein [Gammaproteobacteria bacterium]
MSILRWIAVLLLVTSGTSQAAVQGQEVTYRVGETQMKGYIAYDDTIQGARPGVLVVHEWWGHNEYARRRADMLASQGYTALAVDMYGDGKQADHPEDAKRFSGALKKNRQNTKARFMAALDLLKGAENVNQQQISAIGYCMGGGVVLAMARAGVDLDLVASFHGSVSTDQPAKKGDIKSAVLVFNGAADPFVKPEALRAFESEMNNAGVTYLLVNYPGAKHSFTNPQADEFGQRFKMPLAYDPEADRKSWKQLLTSLKLIYWAE